MTTTLTVNGKTHTVDFPENVPLLWVLRDELGLTGTKFGCGVAQCGACTVHVDGAPIRSCITAHEDVEGSEIVTIEGASGKVADISLAEFGRKEIAIAETEMPGLMIQEGSPCSNRTGSASLGPTST